MDMPAGAKTYRRSKERPMFTLTIPFGTLSLSAENISATTLVR